MSKRTKAELHEALAAAVRAHIKLPCRYWLWIDVRGTSAIPDKAPPPDVETIAEETSVWVRMIEPGPHDQPREKWITADGYEITITALAPRSQMSLNEPPVANPIPPELRGRHTS